MRKMLSAMFIVCILALMSVLWIPAVQASPTVNAEGIMTWVAVSFTGQRVAGVNTIYTGTSVIDAVGTLTGTVTDAFVEIWHSSFLNLRDVLTFTGTVDGKAGTLTICLVGTATLPDLVWTAQWVILSGTGNLANLEGHGTASGTGMIVDYSGMIEFE